MTTPQAGPSAGAVGATGREWARKDLKPGNERGSGEFALGLASLPFVGVALRRRARLWCVFGFVGMLLGIGFYVKAPPPYTAQVTVLLAQPSDVDPLDAIQTDVTLAQTQGVAGQAMHTLGLTGSVTAFLKSFTADSLTDKVVQFTVGAPTASQAVARANALAEAFLNFRDTQLRTQLGLYDAVLKTEVAEAYAQYSVVKAKYDKFQADPPSPTRTSQLQHLEPALKVAFSKWNGLQEERTNNPASTQALISGSYVPDPATPLPRSHFRVPALYAIAGLIGGLATGIGYVVVAGLISDQLRRRDDVARALGTPVRLSVGAIKFSRWPGRGIQAVRRPEVQKIAALLRASLPPRRAGTAATLAIVAVDDPRTAALPVLSLAVSAARAGSQVIVADLTTGAATAKLLGITDPGVRIVATGGQQIALVVPEHGDFTPAGPLHRTLESVQGSHGDQGGRQPSYPGQGIAAGGIPDRAAGRRFSDRGFPGHSRRGQGFVSQGIKGPLAAAYESTDLMLTAVTLDPALGAEHLRSWADKAMVVLTAGGSSATRIHATGEMLREAGLPPSGAILAGADKADFSVGTIPVRAARRGPPAPASSAQHPPATGRSHGQQSVDLPSGPDRRLGVSGR